MDDGDSQELANLGRLHEARERAGVSEREVADALRGTSLAGTRAIEAGERPSLNYEQMIRLARVLGVEASEIIGCGESLAALRSLRSSPAGPQPDRARHGRDEP